MKRKSTIYFILLFFALLSSASAQNTITLVIASDNDELPVLNTAETTLRDTLEKIYPGAVRYVSTTRVSTYDFSGSDLVTAFSNVFAKGFADTLLNRGINVALFGSALYCLEGTWTSASLGNLTITNTGSFLSGYSQSLRYSAQSGSMYYTESALSGDWVSIAASATTTARKVALSCTRNGARSGALGLNITSNTAVGWDMTSRMIRWCMGDQHVTPALVPQDSVALVIENLDDRVPVLTTDERIMADSLHKWGHNLFYVSSSRAGVSDFSRAKFVVLCSNTMSPGIADTLLAQGKDVILLGNSVLLIGNANGISGVGYRDMTIDSSIAFLEGYPVGVAYNLSSGMDYYGASTWKCIGSVVSNRTAFVKVTGEARGAALGYVPSSLTGFGWDIAKRMIRWIKDQEVVSIKPVTADRVTMVIYALNDSTPVLATEERIIRDRIIAAGDSVSYVSSSRVTVTDFSPSKLVVSAVKTLSRYQPDTLVKHGVNVALFGAAVQSMSTGFSTSTEDVKILTASNYPAAFMKGFSSGVNYECGNSAVYGLGVTPSWSSTGTIGGYNTVRYRETDGARGALFGLTPASTMGQFANDMVKRMLFWCTGREPAEPYTCPQDNIAFLINGVDDVTPVLTKAEKALDTYLRAQGCNDISYVSSTRLDVSDFSNARFLIEPYMSMGKPIMDSLLSRGVDIVCLGEAIRKIRHYAIKTDTVMEVASAVGFFEGLYPGMKVSKKAPVYTVDNYVPPYFKSIGSIPSIGFDHCAYLYDSNGVRAAVAGVTPDSTLNVDGWEIVRRILKWITRESIVEPKTAAEGSAVLIINSPDDSTPLLDVSETRMRDSLISYGNSSISYISKFRAEFSDLSKASFVTGVNEVLSKRKLDSLLALSVPAILIGPAITALPGVWNYWSLYSYTRVTSSTDYMAGYAGQVVYRFSNSSPMSRGDDSIAGWKILGVDSTTSDFRQVIISYEHDGVRAAAMNFDPYYIQSYGWDAIKRALHWIKDEPPVPSQTVPPGDIAFVIYNINDTTPSLTSVERMVRDTLLSIGYNNIRYVSSTRAGVTDLKDAKFVITTSNNFSKGVPDSLISRGISTILLGAAVTMLPGDWRSATSSNNLIPDYKTAFLENFTTSTLYDCTNGGHYYPDEPANSVPGWTALGRDATASSTGHRVAFSTERSTGKGAALGYVPDRMTAAGWTVFREMIRWIRGQSIMTLSPENYETLIQNSAYTIQWECIEEIDSIKIEYSSDNGQNYEIIVPSIPNTGYYEWLVPEIRSENCVLRISEINDPQNMDTRYFAIDIAISSEMLKITRNNDFNISQHGRNITLSLSLVKPAIVNAELFSISGKLIGSFRRKLNAGLHTADLMNGKTLARGAYILEIRFDQAAPKKQIVIKSWQ